MLNAMSATQYRGCVGYNDSPEVLGEPSGWWWFEDYSQMWATFEQSESLNRAFDVLGSPTYSAILWVTDEMGFVLFHLFVMSARPIHPRADALIDMAKGWVLTG